MQDMVNKPPHYNNYPVEVFEIIKWVDKYYPGNEYEIGNAIKYLFRAPFKNNTKQDVSKAIWYLNKIVESMEKIETEWQAMITDDKCKKENKVRGRCRDITVAEEVVEPIWLCEGESVWEDDVEEEDKTGNDLFPVN